MALTKAGLTKAPRKAMVKDADSYNTDVLKHLALIINNGSMEYSEKQHKIKNIIDAVYVDGWNHGYGRVEQDARENQMNLRGIVNEKVS